MSQPIIASSLRRAFMGAGCLSLSVLLAALAPFAARADVVTNAVAPTGQAFIKWTGGIVPLVKTYRNPLVLPDGSSLVGVAAVFGPVKYVSTNGLATADGSSWANATTIAHAISLAVDGDVIVISNGTYNAGATLDANTKAITLRGLTGNRDDVILSGAHARKVLNAGGSGKRTVVADLTIAKGVDADGSGIYAYNAVISNCRVTDCIRNSSYLGLAIYATASSQVLGCLLDNNRSTIPISGIFGSYKYSRVRGTLLLTSNSSCDGVVITNNFVEGAYDWEGGVGLWMDSGTARNCLIADNFMRVCDARDGAYAGAVHVGGGVFENSAVYRNVVRGTQSEQIAAVRATGGKVRHCLIADNGVYGTNNWAGAATIFTNCCTAPIGGIVGGIPATGGVYAVADGLPRLPNGSPLIAAGIGPVLPDGAAAFACPFTATKTHALDSLSATLTARPVGDATGLTCTWTLDGDGTLTPAPDNLTAAFSLAAPGTARVTLAAENGAGETFTSTQTLVVSPSTLYVVKNNADAAAPYATWATAAPNIATAVAAATDGAEVIVSNGTYALTAYVPILKDVHVRGASANRDDVFLDCQNNYQAFVLASEGAMVSNMRLYRFASGVWYVANSAGITLFGCGTVTNCHFDGANTTYTSAKAIRNRCGIVRDCTFERCVGNDSYAEPDWTGNGVLIQYGKIALTERCIFTNNSVTSIGTAWGQIYVHAGVVRNCLVANNVINAASKLTAATVASGVHVRGGVIENCSIIENFYSGPQSFVAGLVRSGGVVTNSLIAGNGSGADPSVVVNWLGAPSALAYCATTPIDGTTGGVEADVTTYSWLNGLPRPIIASALIDAGMDAGWMVPPATDIVGQPRLMGDQVDIGAVEFDPDVLGVDFSLDSYEGLDEISATLVANVAGDTTGLEVVWDLDGNGVFETPGETVPLGLSRIGATTVSVRVTNEDDETAYFSRVFTVSPSVLYVVDTNATAAAPYTNWTTAAATIQSAINAAGSGSRVIVSNGTYLTSAPIQVAKDIVLEGLTGDFYDVKVNVQKKGRCIDLISPRCVVSGMTFVNGYKADVSGALVLGGILTNCCITGSQSFYNGGTIYYPMLANVANLGGTVSRCLIVKNDMYDNYYTSGSRSTGSYYQDGEPFAEGCIVSNNTFTKCSASTLSAPLYVAKGTARGFLVKGNTLLGVGAKSFALGAYIGSGRLENCTLVTNTVSGADNATYARYAVYNKAGAVVNTLAADNLRVTDGTVFSCGYATGVFTNSCLPGAASLPGAKNIESVGATTYAFGSDARLLFPLPLNPCQNKGFNEPWMTNAVDLYGNKRVFGPRVDIGCLECQRSAGSVFTIR